MRRGTCGGGKILFDEVLAQRHVDCCDAARSEMQVWVVRARAYKGNSQLWTAFRQCYCGRDVTDERVARGVGADSSWRRSAMEIRANHGGSGQCPSTRRQQQRPGD